MNKYYTALIILVICFCLLFFTVISTQAEETIKCKNCGTVNSKTDSKGLERSQCKKCGWSLKTFAGDSGPDTIDVSKYPAEMQTNYKLFRQKCSKCHTIARAINAKKSGEQWKRYVKRMMNKPGSGISPSSGKKIYQFLKYDSKARK